MLGWVQLSDTTPTEEPLAERWLAEPSEHSAAHSLAARSINSKPRSGRIMRVILRPLRRERSLSRLMRLRHPNTRS